MPVFKVQAPDGRVLSVNAADANSALGAARSQYASSGTLPQKPQGGGALGFVNNVVNQTATGVPIVGGALNRADAATNAALSPVVERLLDLLPGHDRSQDINPAGDYGARYRAALAMQDRRDAQFESDHPVVSGLSQAAGGVLGGLAFARRLSAPTSAPVPAAGLTNGVVNAAKATALGAAIGAADGAVRANPDDVGKAVAAGATLGAGTTLGLSAAGKVLKTAAGPIAGAVQTMIGRTPVGATVARMPARQAAAYVTKKLAQGGVDLPTLQASSADTAAEAGGNATRNALAALARQPGATSENVHAQFGQRAAGRADRILDVVTKATGIDPAAARGNIEALVAKGQADANPLFDAVRATSGPVWNADLADLSQRPAMKKGLAATVEAMKNQGKDPHAVGLAIDPDTGLFKLDQNTLQKVPEPQPTAEAWENVRQMLGDLGAESPNMSNTQRIQAKGYQAAQRDLTTILAGDDSGAGALVPGYRQALDVAGDYKSSEAAFRNARGKLFSIKTSPADLSDMFDWSSPSEQSAMQHAAAADMHDQAQNGLLSLNLLKRPAFRSKLTLLYGPDAASTIGDALTTEAQQAAAERQVMPQAGSQTAPLSAEIKEQQTNPLGELVTDGVTGFMRHGPTGVAEAGIKAGINNIGALMKTPGMGTASRDEAGNLLLMSPQDLHDFLHVNDFDPQPQQSGSVSALPFIGGVAGGQLTGKMLPQQPQP